MVANNNVSTEDSSDKSNNKKYPVEIKAHAKALYLLVDEETGEKKFSHQEIVDEIHERFGDAPARVTLRSWIKDWEPELELRGTSVVTKDSDSLKYEATTKEYVNRASIIKAVFESIRMSLVFHSKRMHKYGSLEDKILDALLDSRTSVSKKKLIKSLLQENSEAFKIHQLLENFKLADVQRGVTESNKVFITHLEKLEKWITLEESNRQGDIVETHADDVWEFEPVDIEEFLEGDEFFGQTLYSTLFECVKADLKNIFYGNPRKILERRRFREIMFNEAYGTGKSIRAAFISCYLDYLVLCLRNPAKYFGLMPGSKITITNVSVSKKQAKDVVFFKIKGMIDQCPWFRKHGYMYDPNNKLELRFDPGDAARTDPDKIYKNVYITFGSSSEFSAVGYDVICAIIDEATAYGIEGGRDKAELIYETFRARISSRFAKSGILVMAGNPHHVDDFLERRMKETKGEKDVYVIKQRSLWEAKFPDYDGDFFYFDYGRMKIVEEIERDRKTVLKIPIMYLNDFESAPELSTRNLAGISLESISRFISNVDRIDDMFVDSGRKNLVEVKDDSTAIFDKKFKPVNDGVHAVHVDIGVTGDAAGIALGHVSGVDKGNYVFRIDCLIRLKGSESNPNILEEIRGIIYQLTQMGFNIGPVSLDGYQSTDFIQIMNRKGYDAYILSVDRAMTCYINMRQALYEGRINCPYHDYLAHELKTLENVNDKKVDHPVKGSKDMADALCGVLNSLIEKVPIESVVSDSDSQSKETPVKEDKKVKVRTPEEVYNSMFDNFEGTGEGA